jgi:ribosomal protein S27E
VSSVYEEIENKIKKIRRLRCKRCGKEWNYKGKANYKAQCPNCYTSVLLPKK